MSDPLKQAHTVPTQPRPNPSRLQEREINALQKRFITMKDGSLAILRFPPLLRWLHGLTLLAITGLAFTGLAQILHNNFLGKFMLTLLGGLDTTQVIHHYFAALLVIPVVLHVLDMLETFFVRRQAPGMLPAWQDLKDAGDTVAFDLGLRQSQPDFKRYSFEQKSVYWLVALGVLLQGLTGLVKLFPIQVTELLPGISIPYAGILHRWTAILIMIVVFIWHLYQVHLRQRNLSILNGRMSLEEMRTSHPLELADLLAKASRLGVEVPDGFRQATIKPQPVAQPRIQKKMVKTEMTTEKNHENSQAETDPHGTGEAR